MRDYAIIVVLAAMAAAGIARPWMATFAYLYVDFIQPHRIAFGPISAFSVNLYFGIFAVVMFFFEKHKNMRVGIIQVLMLVFIAWFTLTCTWALLRDPGLWHKWDASWKAVGFAAFLPFVLASRRRVEAVVALAVICIGLVVINAGVKTALGGGGYANLPMIVRTNKGIYESSTAATLAIAILPLAFYLIRHSEIVPRTRIWKLGAFFLAACSLLLIIGTEARTGLICAGALALMVFWTARRKLPLLAAGMAAGLIALPLLPQSFIDRMSTIAEPSRDVSASTRIEVWKWTLGFVEEHPLGGGFRVFRLNRLEVDIPVKSADGKIIGYDRVEQKARAFHSAYFEVLGELGYPGLAIWLTLLFTTLYKLRQVRQRYRYGPEETRWMSSLSLALMKAIIVYMVGGAFVGIAYQTPLYFMLGVGAATVHLASAQAARERARARVEAFGGRMRSGGFAAPAAS